MGEIQTDVLSYRLGIQLGTNERNAYKDSMNTLYRDSETRDIIVSSVMILVGLFVIIFAEIRYYKLKQAGKI